jgi:hypothetical protein
MRDLKPPRGSALDLVRLLRKRESSSGSLTQLEANWRGLSGQDLVWRVNGLTIAGAISQPMNHLLNQDATQIQQASPSTARGQAAQRFVLDAEQAGGEAATLLETAGRALS